MNNQQADIVTKELDMVGLSYEIVRGGKHPHVHWTAPNGRRRMLTLATTSCSERGMLNARSDVRRALREDGLIHEDVEELPPSPAVMDAPVFVDRGQVFCSSVDVATKFDRAHKDVLRAYDTMSLNSPDDFNQRNFAPIEYQDARGRMQRSINMTRDGFCLLAMRFTGAAAIEWQVKFIEAFTKLESQLAPQAVLEGRIAKLEEELAAATDLLLEFKQPTMPAPVVQTVVVKKQPFMLMTEKRALRKLSRSLRH